MKALLCMAVLFASTAAHAQAALELPQPSPAATVTQTVGITEIRVDYHRPSVGGRAIWGQLVPYGVPWRAGANENTIITFSSDVKIGGKPLRAGTYGLHMIPTARTWTVMFSNVSTAWGSFTYDQKEDALRVTVTPRTNAASEERLRYQFDDPTETKATLVLSWEKLSVPIVIEVDTPKIVMANTRLKLRGPTGFLWQNYNRAATYWLKNGGPLAEALKFVDRSIEMTPAYQNQMTRAAILEKQGKAKEAADQRVKAQSLATEADLNQLAYQLVADKKLDEAIKMFQSIAERFPASWNAQDSLGEALAQKGDKQGAIAAYTKALSLAKDPVQKKRIEATLAKLKAP
jgi:predicted negative regulator of RcsB-dependent stress response